MVIGLLLYRNALEIGLIAAGLLQMCAFSQSNQDTSLKGKVIDRRGSPVTGASVIIRREDAIRTLSPNIVTNDQGIFELDGLLPGTYKVHAMKNEDGYGDPDFSFFAGADQPSEPVVDVKKDLTATVTVQLGDPMGRLGVDIVDNLTGKPLSQSRFRLEIAGKPQIFVSSNPDENGRFVWPVPPTPVVLEISLADFETWHSKPILIKTGEFKRITVHLKRVGSSQ